MNGATRIESATGNGEMAIANALPELLRGGSCVLQTGRGSLVLQGADAIAVGQLLSQLWQKTPKATSTNTEQ